MSDFYSHGSVDAFRQSHFGLGQIGNGFGGPANPLQPMQPMARSVVPPKTISGPSMPAGLSALTSPPRQVDVPEAAAAVAAAPTMPAAAPAAAPAAPPTGEVPAAYAWNPFFKFMWNMKKTPGYREHILEPENFLNALRGGAGQ